MSALALLGCAAIGFIAGVINVVAAGGSFLTLPVLLFLGLPAAVANGTNRVGVMSQNLSAVWGFHRHRVLEWRWALAASVPAVGGALIGVWAALVVPDVAFRRILSLLMVVVTLWTLARRARSGRAAGEQPIRHPWHWTMLLGFFGVGLYGGFVQAGVGFIVLAMTTVAGLDLVRGNAVKVVAVLLVTLLPLAIFAGTGHIHWPLGLALGAGNVLGGLVGVRLAVLHGHVWLERVVTATVIVFAALLWMPSQGAR